MSFPFPLDIEDEGSPRTALDIAEQGGRSTNAPVSGSLRTGRGWQVPSDADRSLGELTYLIRMFPQRSGT